jgi:hypothetical protein
VESLAEAQALELAQLRKQLLQARAQQSAPAKTVVDDNASAAKPKSTPRKKPKPAPQPSQPQQSQPQQTPSQQSPLK